MQTALRVDLLCMILPAHAGFMHMALNRARPLPIPYEGYSSGA
jgi:hypothetical protein